MIDKIKDNELCIECIPMHAERLDLQSSICIFLLFILALDFCFILLTNVKSCSFLVIVFLYDAFKEIKRV